MPVEDEFDLNLISDEQLDKLEQQADRLQKASDKIKQSQQDLGGSPADINFSQEDPASGGIFGGETGGFIGFSQGQKITGGVRGSSIRDKLSRSPAPFDPETGMFIQALDEVEAAMDLLRAEVNQNKAKIEQNVSRMSELIQAEREVLGGATQALGAVANPIGFLKGNLLGTLAKFAIPIGAVLTITTMVFELIKREFGPGGLFDVRKLVTDEVRQFNSLDDIIKFDRGEIYLGFQATIGQRSSDISSTEGKVDGIMRDMLRNEGDYRRVNFGDL